MANDDKMQNNRAPHASPGNGEADPAGTFLSSAPHLLAPEQQVELLRAQGLSISQDEEAAACNALRAYGYKRFCGFASALESSGALPPGSSWLIVSQAVRFNSDLVAFLLRMISLIEVAFRASLVRELGCRYGALALYDEAVFAKADKFQELQQVFDREREQGVRYRLLDGSCSETGRDALPLWDAVELMSLGTASKVYRNLASREASRAIGKGFSLRPDILSNWLRYLTQIRNMCAHQDQLYGARFAFTPRLFSEHAGLDKHRLFPVFIVVFRLMESIDSKEGNALRASFGALVDSYPRVSLAPMGFPANWKELLGIPAAAQERRVRVRGRKGGRPAVDSKALAEALYLYDMKELTVAQIAQRTGVSQASIYKYARDRKQKRGASVEYALVSIT